MNRRLCSFCVAALLVVATSLPAFAGSIRANSEAEAQQIRLKILATRFLDSATFGAKDSEVDALVQRMEQIGVKPACEEWIDAQFALPATYLEPLAEQMQADDGIDPLATDAWVQRYRHHAFWHAAVDAPDQLRQRMAFSFLAFLPMSDGMFNNNALDASGKIWYFAPLHYYDMYLRNCSNSYGDLLRDISLHPCMGNYLSHLRNRKANPSINRFPDENYAREIMQLFSIGLYELNSDGTFKRDGLGNLIDTYNNEDIKSFARVFTGLKYAVAPGGNTNTIWTPTNLHASMEAHEPEHDVDPKTLLNGTVLPAGQTMMQDINGAIDNLMAHPNIAPFIGRRLIQRMVKSNPTKAHIQSVSTAWQNSNGDLKEVIKAVLLHDDVVNGLSFNISQTGPATWTVDVSDNGTEDSKLAEPMVYYAAFLRKFNASPDYPTGRYMMADMGYHWTQRPFGSPSVFSYFQADDQPAGDIVTYQASGSQPRESIAAPEFGLFTAVVHNRLVNRLRYEIYNEKSIHWLINNNTYSFKNEMTLDFGVEKSLASDVGGLVDHLNIKFAKGNLSDELRQSIIDIVAEESSDTTTIARSVILSVLSSPEAMVNR